MQHTNFENLLLDGEINENILNKALLHIGKVRNLEYKSSNGSSFVFISTDNNIAVQYFNHRQIPEKIKIIFDAINKTENFYVNKKFYFKNKSFTLNFKLKNHLSNFIDYKKPDNIIIWEKHVCLNSYTNDMIVKILSNNIIKFIWDISKGLYGLHSLFILHGDPTIDNIGIRNGVFILFDFDSSKINVEFLSFKKDNWEFLKSLKFNLGEEKWNNILEDYPFISGSDSIIDDMIVYMCKETKKDTDILIQDLNNLSIIY